MGFQVGRSVVRLPQLTLQYLGGRRTVLSSSCVERVPAIYNVFQSQRYSGLVYKYKLRTPVLGRAYAQRAVSRPKAHTGRSTTAARKVPTTSKTKAAKKPAPKKTKQKAVPKAKSKAKPRIKPKPKPAKKKKAKPKPKPKPKVKKPKKVLTEAQKKALTIKKLKVKALKSPHVPVVSAWLALLNEKHKATVRGDLTGTFGDISREASVEYKNLTPEGLEHYNHIANQNKAASEKIYRQWIESHTPKTIHDANNARVYLKKLGVRHGFNQLRDDRQVKLPVRSFIHFLCHRMKSGDFKGLKVGEAGKLTGREWKGLSASEKKPFEDLAAQDITRYTQEMKTVMNRDVKHSTATA